MSLSIRCPSCKAVAQVPVELTGKAIRCRDCGAAVRVEAANVVGDVPVVGGLSEPPPDRRIQSSRPNVISPPNVAVIETRKPTEAARPAAASRRSVAPIILLVVIGVLMLLVGGVVAAIAGVLLWSSPSAGPAVQASASPAADEPAAARGGADARPGQLSRETLDALKAATVYIKVDAGRVKGSGSGFLVKVDGETGYVVTNEHVAQPKVKAEVGPRMPFGPQFPRFGPRFGPGLPGLPEFPGFPDLPIDLPTQKLNANLTVVIGSGTATERSLPAELIAADEARDLAVLAISDKNLPRPLDLKTAPEVRETTPVFVLGFPFGEDLAFNRNPEVTIGPATVTSLRSDEKGKPAYVQLQGDMNPGNSGGPVVDSLGRLVGVSFAKIKNTQIGLAVSRQSFDELFQKAIWRCFWKSVRSDRDEAELLLWFRLVDLREKVKQVQLAHAPGILPADVRPMDGGKYGPLPNARLLGLTPVNGVLTTRVTVKARDLVNDQMTMQVVFTSANGTTWHSEPFSHHIAFAGRAPVADAPQPGAHQQPGPAPNQPNKIVEAPPPSTPAEVSLPLPGPPKAVAVGGAGRFLILHQPERKQLAVFDVKSARFAGNIPANDPSILFAAGRDHLLTYTPTGNQFERWNLATLKREAGISNPIPAEIKALAMGSASSGPLVVFAPSQTNKKPGLHLIDPVALKLAEDIVEPVNDHFDVQYKPETFTFGVSPDGRHILQRYVFDWWIFSRSGLVWRGTKFRADSPLPSPDGQVLIDHGQAFSLDGKPLGPKRGSHGAAVWNIPAISSGLTLSFNEVYAPGAKDAYLKIMFHVGGEPEPLATFPRSLPDSRELVDWWMGRPRPFERHVFFAPDLGALVYIPWKKNHLDVYRVDLDQLLKDSKRDYLFVLSQPVLEVQKGSAYRYPIVAKSKKGGVKFELQTGPPGMTVGNDGTLAWTPPANFADRDADVAVTIRDASGQDVRHEFRIAVREK